MQILKQSTAVDVLIGPFVDSTDGDTEETGLTLSAADIKLSKNGQTLAAKNDATAAAHDANGMYNCELDATDTNTVGTLVLFCHESGALAVRHEFQVVEEATYDALFAASAPGYLQPTTSGRTLDVTAGGTAGIDWGNIENKTTANDLSATDIQLCDTITTYTGNTVQTGDAFARLGAPAGASVSADIATVDTVADGIQADLSNATDGLGALKALIDTVDTVVDGIQTDLSNGTDGLGALKTLIDTVDTVVDAIKAVTDNLPNSGSLNDLASILTDTGTTLPATLSTIDTVVDAIKAKTDSLTFTVSNQVDSNVQSINDTTITGDGSTGTEFGV